MSETLRQYLAPRGACEVRAMNVLQDHGVVSDNCVTVDDVGNGGEAVAFFEAVGTWTRGGIWRHAVAPGGVEIMSRHHND